MGRKGRQWKTSLKFGFPRFEEIKLCQAVSWNAGYFDSFCNHKTRVVSRTVEHVMGPLGRICKIVPMFVFTSWLSRDSVIGNDKR